MNKKLFGLLGALFIGAISFAPVAQAQVACAITTPQAAAFTQLIRSAPNLDQQVFVTFMTGFSSGCITTPQASAFTGLVRSSPHVDQKVFVDFLVSFTSGNTTAQPTTPNTLPPSTTNTAIKAPTCSLNVTTSRGVTKNGLTGTGYYDGSGSTYVEINQGGWVTVSWNSTNADYSQGPGGDKDVAIGSATYYPGGDKAYVWNFYGKGGSISCGVMVEVIPTPNVATCTLSASKTTVIPGDSVTLSWTSKDATYASWVQDGTANILGLPLDKLLDFGSQTVTIAGKGVLTPTLSITGKGGSSACSTILSVVPPPTCTLTSKPYMVMNGETTTLTWESQNATYAMWEQNSSANVLGLSLDKLSANGSRAVTIGGGKGVQTPTLRVYGTNSSATCNTTVDIETAP